MKSKKDLIIGGLLVTPFTLLVLYFLNIVAVAFLGMKSLWELLFTLTIIIVFGAIMAGIAVMAMIGMDKIENYFKK